MKILEVLKSPQVHCQWWCDKRFAGEQEGNWIRVNPKLDIVSTIVHEIIHLLQPDWEEERVLKTEERVVKRLTRKQAVAILRAFVKKARM